MQKLTMHTPDLTQGNISRIRTLFPHCVTEAKGEESALRLAVDFDLLRQELSASIVEGPQERYCLDWPGKREAMLTANAPIAKTLRPCREESVDFEHTKNLYIEGDNLDALKLLQETYLGKVKMIYIDPPYNTGNDFIYEDDFAENTDEFLRRSNQKDENGNKLVANTESNGRFHSDWLSMMYPRLKLARNLLRDDGVIFISIDDNEVHNLRKMCDEVFGAENFVANFVVIRSEGGGLAKQAVIGHDYLICYAKNIEMFPPLGKPKDIRGKIVSINNEEYWIETDWLRKEFGKYGTCPYEEIEQWKGIEKKIEIDEGLEKNIYTLIEKEGHRIVGRYRKVADDTSKFYTILKHLNKKGIYDLDELELSKYFDFPKSVEFLKEVLLGATIRKNEGIILDFFSGSATTAHAVMQLNAEDGGNRQFIMVQLPELCDENSEAHKAGYKTIAEIGKERIRRAGAKIVGAGSARPLLPQNGRANPAPTALDIGFRVLKVDSSNMAYVYYTPDALNQSMLDAMTDNIKLGRTPEDLLFQVLLDWGVDLTLPIHKASVQGKTVFFVDKNALIACFDTGITEEFVKELASHKPLRVVFRDNGFASDAVKINATQIFKQMSSGTEVKTL